MSNNSRALMPRSSCSQLGPALVSWIVGWLWLWLPATCLLGQEPTRVEKASERFENVQVLDDMPADQMGQVMNIMSAALGVNCGYCHDGYDFASDDAPLKQTAREMIEMTLRLNAKTFHGRQQISCNTCHRGQPVPDDRLELSAIGRPRTEALATVASKTDAAGSADAATTAVEVPTAPVPTAPVPTAPVPTATKLIEYYIEAVGGKERLASLRSRRIVGERLEPDGRSEPETLWQAGRGGSRMETLYGDLAVVEGFDVNQRDGVVWKRAGESDIRLKPEEMEQIRTEVGIAFPHTLDNYYSAWGSSERVEVDGRAGYAVNATRHSGLKERLVFDARSGLLVQRVVSFPTLLGNYESRVDYRHYRSFDGLQVPTEFFFVQPNLSWSRRVSSVEWNVASE